MVFAPPDALAYHMQPMHNSMTALVFTDENVLVFDTDDVDSLEPLMDTEIILTNCYEILPHQYYLLTDGAQSYILAIEDKQITEVSLSATEIFTLPDSTILTLSPTTTLHSYS